jgi:hypothetical protein
MGWILIFCTLAKLETGRGTPDFCIWSGLSRVWHTSYIMSFLML